MAKPTPQRWAEAYEVPVGALLLQDPDDADAWILSSAPVEVSR